MSVLSLADAKLYLRIESDADDVELQDTIDSAEATIAAKVGPLAAESVVERVQSDGCALVLSRGPYVALTAVAGVYPVEMVNVADLRVDPESQVVTYADGYTRFLGGLYDVTYDIGFDEVPADLMNALKEMVRYLWRPQRGGMNRPGTVSDEDEVAFRGSIPRPVYEMIEDYILEDDLGFA